MARGSRAGLGNRQAKYGLNTLAYVLIAFGIVAAVNMIANRYVKQIDLTASKRFSLSDQTQEILYQLDHGKYPSRNVDLIYFDKRENFGNVRDLLDLYAIKSHNVKVTYVDPDREPSKANQYNVKTYASLVVAAPNRTETTKGLKEEDITNTMIRVLKGGTKTVYFLTGHGERDISSTDRLGYSEAKKALEDSNYTVKTISLMEQSPKLPDDCTVLIIAGPTKDLLDPEISAIKDYIMMKGGRVFFLVYPQIAPKFVDLIGQFGANVEDSLVVDTSGIGKLFGTDELMPLILQYGQHPITKDMGNIATLFPLADAVRKADKPMPGAEFQLIGNTTQNSWATKDVHSKEVSFHKGTDMEGPLGLIGAGVYKSPELGDMIQEGRVVVAGSADMPANAIIGFNSNGNKDLFVNSVNWLASDEDLISIRPKDAEERDVNLTPIQMNMVFYLVLFAVPLAIVAGGLGVWWNRRG